MTDEHSALEICDQCRKPKSQRAGSLTQWVFDEKYCNCGKALLTPLSDPAKEETPFCFTCGKRKAGGRAGSLTQWIFRQEQCRCAQSDLVEMDSNAVEVIEEPFEDEDEDEDADAPELVAASSSRMLNSGWLIAATVAVALVGATTILWSPHFHEPPPKKSGVDLRSMDLTSETLKSVQTFNREAEDAIERRLKNRVSDLCMVNQGMVALHGKFASDAAIARMKLPPVYAVSLFLKSGDVTDKGLEAFYPQLQLQNVNLFSLPNVTESGLVGLCRQNKIRSMMLGQVALGPNLFNRLAKCPDLEVLDSRYNPIRGIDLSVLSHLNNLRALGLRQTEISDEQVDQIMKLPNLITLDITGGGISDDALMKLAKHPSLRALFVAGNNSTTTRGMVRFSKLSKCRIYSSLPYPEPVENYQRFLGNADISSIRPGRPLNLAGWSVSDSGIESIAGRSSEVLLLTSPVVTDKAFPAIARVKGLKSLGLSHLTRATDEGLKSLHGLTGIENLDVSYCNFTDEAIAELCANLHGLKSLIASSTKVGAKTMRTLATNCGALRIIRCDHCHLTDRDLAYAARMPALEQLIINANPDITGKGIAALEKCPALHELQLSTMPEAKMAEIKSRFEKHCLVVFNYNDQ